MAGSVMVLQTAECVRVYPPFVLFLTAELRGNLGLFFKKTNFFYFSPPKNLASSSQILGDRSQRVDQKLPVLRHTGDMVGWHDRTLRHADPTAGTFVPHFLQGIATIKK